METLGDLLLELRFRSWGLQIGEDLGVERTSKWWKVASVGKITSGRLDVAEDDFGKVRCGGETGLTDT